MSSTNPHFTFLLTSAGGGLVCQNIKFIKNLESVNAKVVAVDAQEDISAAFIADYYHSVPRADDPDYIFKMLDICKKYSVNLVIPGSDEEALVLSLNRALFEAEHTLICAADYTTLDILNDKAKTYKSLESISSIQTPRWQQVFSKDEIIQEAAKMHADIGDIVIKPALSRGGRDIVVISDEYSDATLVEAERELHMNLSRFKDSYIDNYNPGFPVIIMQRLLNPVHDIDILSMNGNPLRIVPRKRLNSTSPNSGHILLDNDILFNLAKTLIKHFNLSWLQDIDVMFDKDGTAYILEINPRPSGSFAISVAAGVPIFDDLINLTFNNAMQPVLIDYNQKIIPFQSLFPIKL